ncbi:Hpt domain-containing protein [Flexithrix dorotheae]|uniref:Hpt domain-containing protein n=1 Tax=Flexithrix dorotheae TaxID=70993 RepID=UPI00037C11C6|nr:Hpt domain-containing protein [Flexithrix dorotheae]
MNNISGYFKSGLMNEKIVRSLMKIEDKTFIREILEIFEKQIPIYLKDIELAFQEKNLVKIREILHKMKGSCGTVGANGMVEIIAEIRDLIIAGEKLLMEDLINRLELKFQETMLAMKILFNI